ncbi:C40 family peptidase, partial [Streptomyces sp. A73]|nr:C40 family peptidase [Streptomyces sp. A73]
RALKWARSQAGKPYQWGGAGNPSFDCSGFLSSIHKVIQGKKPKGRLWSTFSFQGKRAPAGWKYHAKSPYQIGITNK